MFLRRRIRTKNDQTYAYWTLVESLRTADGPRQRHAATAQRLFRSLLVHPGNAFRQRFREHKREDEEGVPFPLAQANTPRLSRLPRPGEA